MVKRILNFYYLFVYFFVFLTFSFCHKILVLLKSKSKKNISFQYFLIYLWNSKITKNLRHIFHAWIQNCHLKLLMRINFGHIQKTILDPSLMALHEQATVILFVRFHHCSFFLVTIMYICIKFHHRYQWLIFIGESVGFTKWILLFQSIFFFLHIKL
jgi:hypothetical protein